MKADACPSGSAGNAASVRTFPTAVGVWACACPGGAQRRHLYKDKHTPHRQFFNRYKILHLFVFILVFLR